MRINLPVALGVVFLDMLEHGRLPESGHVPVELPDPAVQIRISGADVADVALEVLHVDGIEANDGRVEPHVRFRDVGAEVVGSAVVLEPFG